MRACGVEAAFDADACDEVGEAEAAAADADRGDEAHRVGVDLIGGAGDPVAAGGADVADDGVYLDLRLFGAAADEARDEVGLDGRAAGAVDIEDDGLAVGGGEALLDQRLGGGEVEAAQARGDHAVQHDHVDARLAPEGEIDHGIASRGMVSRAALSPLSQAPPRVPARPSWQASPAKINRPPASGSARRARAAASPGRA